MSYDPKDYEKKRLVGMDVAPPQTEVVPTTRADDASAKWAAAHNWRQRCEMETVEANARLAQAQVQESEAWHSLEIAAGRAPDDGQAMPSPLRAGYAQNGRLG